MELGFDKALSKAAFERTLYLVLRANCAGCHNTDTRAQAPIHADLDVNFAHEYALTRVNSTIQRTPSSSCARWSTGTTALAVAAAALACRSCRRSRGGWAPYRTYCPRYRAAFLEERC